jgi:hypothetical protein
MARLKVVAAVYDRRGKRFGPGKGQTIRLVGGNFVWNNAGGFP